MKLLKFNEMAGDNLYNVDKNLIYTFTNRRNYTEIEEGYFDKLNSNIKKYVLDFLNYALPIVYSPENEPDNFWNRRNPMDERGLYDGGGYSLLESKNGEKCYDVYFDCDAYRFEGHVYVTPEMDRVFFTDWENNNDRTEEISSFFN